MHRSGRLEARDEDFLILPSMVDAIPALTTDKAVKLFEILQCIHKSRAVKSRAEIQYEGYAKAINIEAKTMVDIATKQIIPAVIRYTTVLAESINSVKAVSAALDVSVQTSLLEKSSILLAETKAAMDKLSGLIAEAEAHEEGRDRAVFFRESVVPAMKALRNRSMSLR